MTLIVGKSQGLISAAEVPDAAATIVPLRSAAIAEAVRTAATNMGAKQSQISRNGSDGSYIGKIRLALTHVRTLEESTLLARWRSLGTNRALIEWVVFTLWGNGQPVTDPNATSAFGRWLDGAVQVALSAPPPAVIAQNPVVPPGERPPVRYEGQLYDYSALAQESELDEFRNGILPLGRSAFGQYPQTKYGARRFLPLRGGAAIEELGVLLCAPQGTGKTHLLVEWAAAASAAGRTVVIIDVKGNMRAALDLALGRTRVSPDILEFTTDVQAPSDRLNLLAAITADQPDCSEQLARVAEALMPADDFKGRGEEGLRHKVAVRILRGALLVLKLMEWYGIYHAGRATDLVDLQLLVAREAEVLTWIIALREQEAWRRANGQPMARFSVEESVELMSLAFGQTWQRRHADGSTTIEQFPEGERPPEYRYQQYLVPILAALDPFRPSGYMAERVRSHGAGREIRIDQLGRDGQAPVVLITAREEDSSIATALLGVTMRRLRQAIDQRRNLPSAPLGEILLLLDETRRIPGFDAAEFVSIVRQNRVGYVLVYQSLGLIEPQEKAETLMSNIGTQIFLGGLSGLDLDMFNRQLPLREHVRQWHSLQPDATSGSGKSFTESGRDALFLDSPAASRFQAGRYPALVNVRNGPAPFLVDLDTAQSQVDGAS